MTNEAQTTLIALGTGAFGSAATLFGIWIKARSDARVVTASASASAMDAISRGFETLVEHLSKEVEDLRGRIQVLEAELRRLREREEQLMGDIRNYQALEGARSRQ